MSEVARQALSKRRTWASPGGNHDRIVWILQFLLPVGIGVLGAFLVLAPLFAHGDVSFLLDKNKVAVAHDRLRLEAAHYRGVDSQGRPFELTAGSAVQRSEADPIMRLQNLTAAIQLADGPAQFRADRGRYDMSKEQIMGDGPLHFQTSGGYTLNTENATLDLKTRRIASSGPVQGTTPMGNFSGDRLHADLETHVVDLDGNARLRFSPKRANKP